MSGEVSGGFTDIGLQKCEKRFGLWEAVCQEVAAPCHEGGERHEKAGEEDIAVSLSQSVQAAKEVRGCPMWRLRRRGSRRDPMKG